MAKNWVVSIRPVSPYQAPMPQSSGSGLNALVGYGGALGAKRWMVQVHSSPRVAEAHAVALLRRCTAGTRLGWNGPRFRTVGRRSR